MSQKLPSLFIPHGGGPCFFMDWPPPFPKGMWDSMAAFLRSVDGLVGHRPKAVLVISGHWETAAPAILSKPRHSLLFDYSGFPPHTYELSYPAAGSPETAGRVAALLREAGVSTTQDSTRGLDHGVFVPFMLVYPEADVPMVQLSLPARATPAQLLAIGRALAPLRDEDVLIVGSGMSYHNVGAMVGRVPGQQQVAAAFDAWLGETMADPDPERREALLSAWEQAPYARQAHPTPEHFWPLLVAAGAGAGDPADRIYHAPTMGLVQSAFRFGAPA